MEVGYDGMGYAGYDDSMMEGTQSDASSNPGLMANGIFVFGITGAVFLVSVVIGVLLAKKRIKKGFDQYED